MVRIGMEFGIPIGVDSTDHFALICPECDRNMEVRSVETLHGNKSAGGESCTFIYARCHKCGLGGQRKIYWQDYDAPMQYRTDRDQSADSPT